MVPYSISKAKVDSLKGTIKSDLSVEIYGEGYDGYDFILWYKGVKDDRLFFKAINLVDGSLVDSPSLENKSEVCIDIIDSTISAYSFHYRIVEGNLDTFYPVRFELWRKRKGELEKIFQKEYFISGWER